LSDVFIRLALRQVLQRTAATTSTNCRNFCRFTQETINENKSCDKLPEMLNSSNKLRTNHSVTLHPKTLEQTPRQLECPHDKLGIGDSARATDRRMICGTDACTANACKTQNRQTTNIYSSEEPHLSTQLQLSNN